MVAWCWNFARTSMIRAAAGNGPETEAEDGAETQAAAIRLYPKLTRIRMSVLMLAGCNIASYPTLRPPAIIITKAFPW